MFRGRKDLGSESRSARLERLAGDTEGRSLWRCRFERALKRHLSKPALAFSGPSRANECESRVQGEQQALTCSNQPTTSATSTTCD